MINKYISDEQYKQFERIDKKKIELKDLINNSSNKKTTIVELCGLPRTGKTSSIRRMYKIFLKQVIYKYYVLKNQLI